MHPQRNLLPIALLLLITLVGWQVLSVQPTALAATPASVANCPPNWQRVNSPNPRSSNRLESIAAIADDDIWTVGYTFDFAATPDSTLTMYWDGTQWSEIPSPSPAPGSYLEDVVAFASDDVWAAGYYYPGYAETLTMHWDGTEWSVIPSPNQGPSTNELHAIDGVAPDDIWAVGNTPATHNTVAMHWDGEDWTIFHTLPNDFMNEYRLNDVVAISSDDVWAVGYYFPESGSHRSITLHWNGTNWSRIPSPNPGSWVTQIYGVAAVSSDEVYAVGYYTPDSGSTYLTLLLKWNGTNWIHIPTPNGSDSGYNMLSSITVGADGELWAAGYYYQENLPGVSSNTLILRYAGDEWQVVNSPKGNYYESQLYGITTTPGGDLWTVGRSYDYYNQPWETLILRNDCEAGGTPTPAPTLTATRTATSPATITATVTPSRTPTATMIVSATATNTPLATASATPGSFPTATSTPLATVSTTAFATRTATPIATVASSPTATPVQFKGQVYLPLILR